jgi:hypothetical protein
MVQLPTSANSKLIVAPVRRGMYALIFPVETNFHKMVRRPGGMSREQALRNAQRELRRFVHLTMSAGQPT